jgi:hypothetical protein
MRNKQDKIVKDGLDPFKYTNAAKISLEAHTIVGD